MLDISRDRVPTRETLDRLVELMALARINQFQLYTEHTFAYRHHEEVWRDASPITPDDIAWLQQRCAEEGIELVPNQNCFGHMERWLKHPAYRQRAETPDGYEPVPGFRQPAGVLAPTPDNAAFVLSLLAELLRNFTSRRVNIGCDETFELGRGASRERVEREGKVRVYAEHLRRIIEPLVAEGREVLFWDDIARQDPDVVHTLPAGSVALIWTYESPKPPEALPELPPEVAEVIDASEVDLSAPGFGPLTEKMAGRGFPFWVAPGTSSWNSLVGRIDNAVGNLVDAAEMGLAHGAGGYLITDWGDGGHMQPPSVSFGPLLFGGAVSWCLESNRSLDLTAAVDRLVFADAAAQLGGALDGLGRVWSRTGQRAYNSSPLDPALAGGGFSFVTGDPDAGAVEAVIATIEEALVAIAKSEPACRDGSVVRQELTAAARLARHGAWRLLRRAGGNAPDVTTLRADLAEAIELQQAAWLSRSRPGGLTDSLARLRRTLDSYTR
jgi:hypothetical protein